MTVELIKSHIPYAANTYKLTLSGRTLVVDPAAPRRECDDLPDFVLLTHAHFDHILYIDDWVGENTEVLIASEERDRLSDPDYNCYRLFLGSEGGYFGRARGLSDKESINVGSEFLRFMHTPGHTEGSGIYVFDNIAFVGDTVFAGGGFGRWDLPGGDVTKLRQSIGKICELPDDMILYPGHGESTTVSDYKKYLKF